jgi:2-methylcitrate dehydratase PrpD
MTLAEYAASTSIAAIPDEVKERAKQVIFDEMACARFGRRSLAGQLAARYAEKFASPAESRILGTSLRVPAPYAAMANGAAGHGEEVDGAHVIGGHPGATLVHAAVAMADRQCASGVDLLSAVVLGYDVGTRLIAACGGKFHFQFSSHHHPDFLHGVAASVVASRLLGLDPNRYCHSMAMATFQTNGLAALFQERRHVSKSFCNGQYAFAGVSAALMSSGGLEGCEDILGARDGLLDAWGIEGGADVLTRRLGQDYEIMGANFKFLNAGYPIHAAVEAAMTLVTDHDIRVDTIESVHVGMPANAMRIVDNRHMHNICVQDMVSASLVRGGLSLRESPFPAILGDPAFIRVRARITVGVDPDVDRDQPNGRGANVTITRLDGSTVSLRVDHPRGHSLRGAVTWDELLKKWHEALPESDIDKIFSLAQRLEELEDVNVLSGAFGSS